MTCRKHEPEWLSDNLLDQIAGKVRCKNCGMRGQYSNGQRKFGRPRRIIWFRMIETNNEASTVLNTPANKEGGL